MRIDEGDIDGQKNLLLEPGMHRSLPFDVDHARRLDEQIDVSSSTIVPRAGSIQPDGGVIANGFPNDPDDLLALCRTESHEWRVFFDCRSAGELRRSRMAHSPRMITPTGAHALLAYSTIVRGARGASSGSVGTVQIT